MGRRFTSLSLIFFFLIGLLTACASFPPESEQLNSVEETEDTLTRIRKRDKIIIGVSTDFPPFGFLDQERKNIGLEIDIARYITKKLLGSVDKVQFVPIFDASKRIELLKNKKIDLVIASIRDLPQNRQEIDLSRHYYSSGFGFLTRKDNGINSWSQLKGQTVCGIRGSYWNKALSKMGFELIEFRSFDQVNIALKERRCIGLVYSHSKIASILKNPEWAEKWHQGLPIILSVPWSMGLPQGDNSFKKAIDDAIITMESKGFLVKTEAKWNLTPTEYVQERVAQAKVEIDIDTVSKNINSDYLYDNNILIDGSKIISPLSDRIATKYVSNHPNVRIVVGQSDTDEGIKKLCHGEIDIANASRPLSLSEIELCSANGIEYVEVPFAFDGIVIAVNPQNDWLDCIRLEELSKIWGYRHNKALENWNQISALYPHQSLQLFGILTNSETYDYFMAMVVGKNATKRYDYIERDETRKIIRDIAQNANSLGFFNFNINNTNQDAVKIISIMNQKGRCVKPNAISIADGTYTPLSRPLFFYVNKKSLIENYDVKAFTEYFLAEQNTFEITSIGYVALPRQALNNVRYRLQNMTTGSLFEGNLPSGLELTNKLSK